MLERVPCSPFRRKKLALADPETWLLGLVGRIGDLPALLWSGVVGSEVSRALVLLWVWLFPEVGFVEYFAVMAVAERDWVVGSAFVWFVVVAAVAVVCFDLVHSESASAAVA